MCCLFDASRWVTAAAAAAATDIAVVSLSSLPVAHSNDRGRLTVAQLVAVTECVRGDTTALKHGQAGRVPPARTCRTVDSAAQLMRARESG